MLLSKLNLTSYMFFNSTPSKSVTETAQAVGGNNVAFIDVRTRAEYQSGHAKGAENIPLDTIDGNVAERLKKYDEVYVICQSGARSASATKVLIGAAVKAINVSGGTMTWRAHGLPME